jgi:ribosomal protein S21
MVYIKVGKHESLDSAILRFRDACEDDQISYGLRRQQHYAKPNQLRRWKVFVSKRSFNGKAEAWRYYPK